MRQQIAVLLFVFFTGLLGGFLWGSGQEPERIVERIPVIRYLPMSTPTFTPSIPDITKRFVPLERDEVRVDTVYVPTDMDRYVVTEFQRGIEVTPRQVSFKYFDPTEQRWGIDVYSVPERRFDLGLYADTHIWDFAWHEPTVGAILEARYRSLHLGIGPYYSLRSNDLHVMLNLKFRIL